MTRPAARRIVITCTCWERLSEWHSEVSPQGLTLRAQTSAGLAPIGWTGQDGDARSPFGSAPDGGGAAVDSGRFEVDVPLRHQPPVLQLVGPAQARVPRMGPALHPT